MNYSFPDPLAPDSEKAEKAYGLKWAKGISQEWFNGGMITDKCSYANRSSKIRKNRLYTRGKQDISVYKKLLEDLNYLNVDWTPLNIAGKFIDIVANGIRDERYRVDISAIDKVATLERRKYREKLEKDMRTKAMLTKVKDYLGINLVPQGFVPKNKEQLEMHLQMSDKLNIEILEELLIKFVKGTNNYDVIKQQIDLDLVENALAGLRCYTDKINGVTLKLVDIEKLVHGYIRNKDFSDCNYYGEVVQKSIAELQRESGYSEKELRDVASIYSSHHSNNVMGTYDFQRCAFSDLLDIKVDVLHFTFKTSKTLTYKKKFYKRGGFKMIEKDSDYNPPQRNDYKKVTKVLDTWYEGSFVIGTEMLYDYKESEILSRDKMNKALPSFIMFSSDYYDGEPHSLSERLQPIVEQMNRTHLKIQQIISQMRPDETEIDIDLLAELESKTGKKLTWEDAVNLYNAKGIVLSTRVNMGDDGIKDRAALRVPTQQQSGKLESLTRAWLFHYNVIRDLTGVNSARDGSQPSDVLVGVQELQLEMSNTATKAIADAALEITRKTAEVISTRLTDIFKWGDDLIDVYKNAVGSHNLELLKSLEDRHLHEFGFIIQMLPTSTEIQEFKESLGIALDRDLIDIDDKIKAERIASINIKQAEDYLTFRKKQRVQEKRKDEEARNQSLANSNAQAAQVSEQAKQKTIMMESSLKIKEARELAIIEVMKQNELNKVNQPKEEREYEVEIFIEKLKKSTGLEASKMIEDRKDKRTQMTASQTSRMIQQKQQPNSQAINFEDEAAGEDLSFL